MIRPLLDPTIASKISFTKTNADLQKYISPENLQTRYGGTDSWEYRYMEPVPGENAKMRSEKGKDEALAHRHELILRFEQVTSQWVCLDPVSIEGKGKKAEREELVGLLKESFWRLDPYVRARTHYHRLGVIDGAGGVDYMAVGGR